MEQPFENRVKQMLRQGRKTAGAWLQIGSPMTAEIMSQARFDWLLIDIEHGPGDLLTLISQLQAMKGSGVVPLVRAPWNDFVIIKRILDTGAYGVVIPWVNTKAQAQAAVQACKYPPEGIRGIAISPRAMGFGQNLKPYLTRANDEILIIIQVETREAISNLDEILDVPGIDGIFVGPVDLATSMGHLADPRHPDVQSAIKHIETKVLNKKRTLGTVAATWEQAKNLYDRGYQMVTLMADGASLARLAVEQVSKFREAFPAAEE